MEKNGANLYTLNESVFAVIGEDGATNFGIVKGEDGLALLTPVGLSTIFL